MLKNFLRLLPVMALAVAAALPAPAAAAGGGGGGTGITLTVGQPTLSGRLLVTVPVTVQCSGPIADAQLAFGFVNVSIQQAYGQTVSNGSGGMELLTCPSTPQTVDVLVSPNLYPTPSGPFHGGPALVTASAFAQDITATNFAGGSFGPAIVRI